ncbi:glycerol-3-phosphate 1-O-acyltransferase [Biomaibacter acetigenes]|uniref:Glycerol-3-phosphate acyltransferase n=1 Tax=Biomaibacter acetigenes TaxID=2316383 RepID=A0A3G2R887_9FIRM|nr:glycerol-3-phosphate 1-O-acyltransferase PlsY [Biomaibacter acetigenes]AYO31702.1 glycerol-3-phosphate 1-O-acyltransferase [Biomaibacter acetigenes]
MAKYIISLIASYFIGSISTAYLVSKNIYKVDIRQYGSKNPGSTNVLRVLGAKPAAVVFIMDLLKGLLVVLLARYIGGENLALLCGLAVVVGHDWSVFLKFNGGKGIATSLGVVLGISPAVALWVLIAGVVVIILFRFVSLGSITGAVLFPILLIIFNYPAKFLYFGLALAAMGVWRHRSNIKRLISGTENKIGRKSKTG